MKKIPKFQSEDEEREFWATHDSTEYVEWDNAEQMDLPNLKPSSAAELSQDSPEPAVLLDESKGFWAGIVEFRNSVDWDLFDEDEDIFENVRDQSTGREENPWDD